MTKYVQLPPMIDAIQWDGTIEGAEKVRDFLNQFRGRRVSLNVNAELGVQDDNEVYITLHIEGEGRQSPMRPKHWAVVHENGDFEVVHEKDFARHYALAPMFNGKDEED